MRKFKTIIIFALILSMVTLTGCWNYVDVDKYAIVSGMAIDKGSGNNLYHVTFEVVDISQGKESPIKPIILETEAKSIFEAVKNTGLRSSKTLYFRHCNLYVIGKDMAKEGIIPILNWLNSDDVMRQKSNIAISKMDTAKEVLLSKPTTENLVSFEIANMLNEQSKLASKTPQVWLSQASDHVNYNGSTLYLPSVGTVSQTAGEGQESGESGGSQDTGKKSQSSKSGNLAKDKGEKHNTISELDGTAIFKNDRLVGFLNSEETQYFLCLRNQVKGGALYLDKGIKGRGVTLKVMDSTTKITPIINGDDVTMKVKINLVASMTDDESDENFNNEKGLVALERIANQKITENIKTLVTKVQTKYDSDVFGFGRTIYQKDYDNWKKLSKNWDKRFKNVNVDVEPDVEILNTAVQESKLRS